MSFQQSSPPEVATLLAGIAMGESPRWHDNRLWLSDWGAREILAVDAGGRSEIILRTPFELPFCIDWLPDGRLLIVAGRENRLVRWEPDGSLVTHADLRGVSDGVWNEIVVDGRGNAYVNGGPGIIAAYFSPLDLQRLREQGLGLVVLAPSLVQLRQVGHRPQGFGMLRAEYPAD